MKWFGACLLALAFIAGCGADPDGSTGSGEAEPVDFSFTTFEGDEFSAVERRGTPVVLNFWESW